MDEYAGMALNFKLEKVYDGGRSELAGVFASEVDARNAGRGMMARPRIVGGPTLVDVRVWEIAKNWVTWTAVES